MGSVIGWLKDKLFGKAENGSVYEGLSDMHRRNREKRRIFLQKKSEEMTKLATQHHYERERAPFGSKNEPLRRQFVAYLKYRLYVQHGPYPLSAEDLVKLDDRIMKDFVGFLHPDQNTKGDFWPTVLELVNEDPILKPYVPGLFNGGLDVYINQRDDRRRWKLEQERAAEKAALELLEKHLAMDAPVLAHIDNLRQEVRALRELFYPLPVGHPEKTRLMYRIDATQNAIGDLKAKLKLPIPKASEDWA